MPSSTEVNAEPFTTSVEIIGNKIVRDARVGDFTARHVEGGRTVRISGLGVPRYIGPADPESARLKRWLLVHARAGVRPGLEAAVRRLSQFTAPAVPPPPPAPPLQLEPTTPPLQPPIRHVLIGHEDNAADEVLPDRDDALPLPTRLLDLPPAEPLDFAVDRLFVKDDVNGIVGDGDAGKSSLLFAVTGAVAAGESALGELAAISGPVMFSSGEDSRAVICNRLEAIAAGHRWDRERLLGNVHVFDEGVDLDDPKWQRHLIEAANDLHIVLAIFDPLGDLCGDGVDENSNTDAKRVTRYLRHFMRRTRATPVLSMHVSKPSEARTERKHRVRGASAWRNATRACWWVEGMEGGMELDPIKRNRLASSMPLRVKRTVVTDPDHAMMWKAAHLSLDAAGDVVGQDVMKLLRWLATCSARMNSRGVAGGDHGIPRDRASAALITASGKRWVDHIDGPRRAHLWAITEAGKARLLLESAPVSGTVR